MRLLPPVIFVHDLERQPLHGAWPHGVVAIPTTKVLVRVAQGDPSRGESLRWPVMAVCDSAKEAATWIMEHAPRMPALGVTFLFPPQDRHSRARRTRMLRALLMGFLRSSDSEQIDA